MKKSASLNKIVLTSAAAMLATGLGTVANADQFTHGITQFTPASATHTLSAEANSFYNPSMGYNGWLHTSKWGYVKLKKGLPVTITAATADQTGLFHPAIAVWLNAGSSKVECATGTSIGEGPYLAWADVYVKKLGDFVGCPKEKNRSLILQFVANGVDRDGWDEPADAGNYADFALASKAASKFDNTMINRILDGTAGKVSVTFTPEVSGIYKFVVGGMNPDAALGAVASTQPDSQTGTSVDKDLTVTVTFPE